MRALTVLGAEFGDSALVEGSLEVLKGEGVCGASGMFLEERRMPTLEDGHIAARRDGALDLDGVLCVSEGDGGEDGDGEGSEGLHT
jgi:hypothetical protein